MRSDPRIDIDDSYRSNPQESMPLRPLPKRPLPSYTSVLLPGLSLASGALLGFAMPSLIEAAGFIDYAKCALLAVSAAGVSYGINRLAIERGAAQAAIGSKGALLASTASILLVGAGLFGATYAGLVLEDTDQLQLEDHGRAQARVIIERSDIARKSARIVPAVQALAEELQAKAACEATSSCFSGRGNGGQGSAFRALSNAYGRANVVVGQVRIGEEATAQILFTLNALQDRYQSVVADDGLSADERRAEAQAIHSRIGQALGELDEATPTTLVAAYADELGSGAGLSADSELEGKLDGLLGSQAGQLRSVIATLPSPQAPQPAFPPRAGVSDTLARIGHFLPIAMIIGVLELVFPITLWFYTYFALSARLLQGEPEYPAPEEVPARREPPKRAKGTRNV